MMTAQKLLLAPAGVRIGSPAGLCQGSAFWRFCRVRLGFCLPLAAGLLVLPAPLRADVATSVAWEGEWRITARTEVLHAAYAMPPERYSRCISGESMNPAADPPGRHCRLVDEQISGSSYRWQMQCVAAGDRVMEVAGEAVYAGDSMRGSVRLVSGELTRVRHIRGYRVGPCRP